MNTHKCRRCGYTTDICSNYIKHLHRSIPCDPILEDVSISILQSNLAKLKNRQYKYKCDFCDKTFKTPQNKYQHKQNCKKRRATTSVEDELPEPSQCSEQNYAKLSRLLQENARLQEQVTRLQSEASTAIQVNPKRDDLLFYEYLRNGKGAEKDYQYILEKHYGHGHRKLMCGVTDITTDTFHGEIKAWNSWKESIGQLHCYNSDDPKSELHVYLFGEYSSKHKSIACNKLQEQGFMVFEFIYEDSSIYIHNLNDGTRTMVWQGICSSKSTQTDDDDSLFPSNPSYHDNLIVLS
jgi:hypothetical protein